MCGDLFLPLHATLWAEFLELNKLQNNWISGILLNSVEFVRVGKESGHRWKRIPGAALCGCKEERVHWTGFLMLAMLAVLENSLSMRHQHAHCCCFETGSLVRDSPELVVVLQMRMVSDI